VVVGQLPFASGVEPSEHFCDDGGEIAFGGGGGGGEEGPCSLTGGFVIGGLGAKTTGPSVVLQFPYEPSG
jgi:hypothetical protein